MSLIQKALKKSVQDQETPSPLPAGIVESTRGGGAVSKKQIGLVIVLLLGLVGLLTYSFYPYLWKRTKKITPPPQVAVKKEITPAPQAPPIKEKAPSSPVLTAKAEPQDQSPIIKKPSAPSSASENMPVKKTDSAGTQEALLKKSPAAAKPQVGESGSANISPIMGVTKTTPKAARQTTREGAKTSSEFSRPQTEGDEKGSLEVIRTFNEAVRDQKKGLWEQAMQGYQEVLILRPNHPEAYNNLGLIYQEQKQFPKALEMFQKAISLNPRYTKGYNNLGLLYLSQGKWEEAGAQFRKALEIDSNFVPAYINLSTAYKNQGRPDLARKALYRALEKDNNNLEAQYNLGLLWESEGVPTKAVEHYQKFVAKAYGPYTGLADDLRKRWPELK
ncbi:MAG TPA: tetratricopeptide repeat protein [Thermodesulfobacteriota bacterium]|nr:tetratricopeptide repeat protein [Thermodesulfobacteriota bacterium]